MKVRILVERQPVLPKWKGVVGFDDYGVSDQGQVWSNKQRGRMLKGSVHGTTQYPNVMLTKGGKLYFRYVHNLMLEAFVGPRPKGFTCNHKDGDKTNNVLSNLEWVPHSANMQHAHDTGLIPKERKPQNRIKIADVIEVKALLEEGNAVRAIARVTGFSRRAIADIKSGKTWADVDMADAAWADL
jgi:hypothetical protein